MGGIVDDLLGGLKSFFSSLVETYFFSIFYYLECGVLYIMFLGEQLMMIFTGEKEVLYNGEKTDLLSVFFNSGQIRGIYSGMAMIGIVFAFVFALVAVCRKIFDARDKMQGLTLGGILGNLLKSILIIASMNLIMTIALSTTNTLMKQVSYAITMGPEFSKGEPTHTFTEDEFAAMGRILNTIGNYSLNPSSHSRYNLNACYNDIRKDLKYLGEKGVFNYHYVTVDKNNKTVTTWQSLMEELATAYDYNKESPLETYDQGLTNAILDVMDIMEKNPNIKVLKEYTRTISTNIQAVPIDRVLFVAGTMGTIWTAAANNDVYNKKPEFTDNVRGPFYRGEKSIYSFEKVHEVFSVNPLKMNYVLVAFACWMIIKEMVVVVASCGVRIFNLLALYVTAPLAISTMPMDDGGKFKQWSTAFVIQLLSVLGMVVALRLFLIFLPMIWSPALSFDADTGGMEIWGTAATKLKILDYNGLDSFIVNNLMSIAVRIILTYCGVEAIGRVNGIFTGILADNAGMQAIYAGDLRGSIENSKFGRYMNRGSRLGIGDNMFDDPETKKRKKQEEEQKKKEKEQARSSGAAQAEQRKAQKNEVKRQKELAKVPQQMKQMKADIDHLENDNATTHMDGSKVKEGDLEKMKKAYDYMSKGNMTKKEAFAQAEKDMKSDRAKAKKEGEFRKAENRVGPPDRKKCADAAQKMNDGDYKAMKRDLAYMEENGTHANGKAIKPGDKARMQETLRQYEAMRTMQGAAPMVEPNAPTIGPAFGGPAPGGDGPGGDIPDGQGQQVNDDFQVNQPEAGVNLNGDEAMFDMNDFNQGNQVGDNNQPNDFQLGNDWVNVEAPQQNQNNQVGGGEMNDEQPIHINQNVGGMGGGADGNVGGFQFNQANRVNDAAQQNQNNQIHDN
ncbi:MAG: hypothetical protein IKQ71_00460 [Lachnospiraceae bacterium]|nr:hypothetical protein [Lachnospiraceae bacterium]